VLGLLAGGVVVGDLHGQPFLVAVVERSSDQTAEQRMGAGRARLELRVRLRADEVRMRLARQLDELDEAAVR